MTASCTSMPQLTLASPQKCPNLRLCVCTWKKQVCLAVIQPQPYWISSERGKLEKTELHLDKSKSCSNSDQFKSQSQVRLFQGSCLAFFVLFCFHRVLPRGAGFTNKILWCLGCHVVLGSILDAIFARSPGLSCWPTMCAGEKLQYPLTTSFKEFQKML